ncbi:MAG: hypothetical protein JSU94_15285 [Phycisphaerales bacterium]|nr:MAG: hypothetical protein JSU94_15285 [Phycisphaerales bacterium]
MVKGRLAAIVLALMSLSVSRAAPEADIAEVERRFRYLPMESRRLMGPLFWLHGEESKEQLEMYVGKVAEGGNGTFVAESRPHKDWLGQGWFRDLGICLAEAKKHNLTMWIFDEKWFPSGEVGGEVPRQYGCKRLVVSTEDVVGPKRVERGCYGGANFVGAVAGRAAGSLIKGESLIDLSACVRDGRLIWNAPGGDWKLLKFTWKHSSGRILVDGLSRDAVDWYIQTVFQPHYERFKEDFGESVAGYFYDEPETRGDWGPEVMKVLAERGVDWKKALVAWKLGLAGEENVAAKYQYRDAVSEAWGRTLYGQMSRWCRERGVLSIGHFLEHGKMYLNQELCAGNIFQLQKYSDMGGIDAVFAQFVSGKRHGWDAPVWQTPKMGSSISHVYGKPDDVTMVEIFGGRGQSLAYTEMKWCADHMYASGVNFLIPHAFNPKAPFDQENRPYFYNGGYEARWPMYRVLADYTSRLSVMLTGGRHVAPVALLFLGNSFHVGRSVTPEQISEALQDALYDCDWLPYEVFEDRAKLAGREIWLYKESYKILLVPPVEVIPYATLAKAKAFFDKGGVVAAYGFLPTKSATLGRSSSDIGALCEAVWGKSEPGTTVCKTNSAGGRSYLLPEEPTVEQLQQVLAVDAGIRPTLKVVAGRTDNWLHVLHRVKSGRDVFFVTNQNHLGDARRFRFRITAEGVPECWDPMRNELTSIAFTRNGRQVELELCLEPLESVLLVFQEKDRALARRIESDSSKVAGIIPVVRDEEAEREQRLRHPESKSDSTRRKIPHGGSGVKVAPFFGRCEISGMWRDASRVYLEADELTGDQADAEAHVTVNGRYAGGFIGRPLRLNVTKHLKMGSNSIVIRPFRPKDARIVIYE